MGTICVGVYRYRRRCTYTVRLLSRKKNWCTTPHTRAVSTHLTPTLPVMFSGINVALSPAVVPFSNVESEDAVLYDFKLLCQILPVSKFMSKFTMVSTKYPTFLLPSAPDYILIFVHVTVIEVVICCCVPNFVKIGSRVRPPDTHNCWMFNVSLLSNNCCHGNHMSGTWWDAITQVSSKPVHR